MQQQSFRDRVRPWACASCGQRAISANKQVCPKCHEPRAGSVVEHTLAAEAAAELATGQAIREYTSVGDMQQGIAAMAAQGWRVQSQTSYQPRQGAGRIVALGFVGAALFKPAPKFVVTYAR